MMSCGGSNPSLRACIMKIDRATLKSKLSCLKHSARNRNIVCSLTLKDLEKIFEQTNVCFYFGRPLTETNVTVDRIDCNKGYKKNSIVLCTKEANNLKNQLFESPSSRLAIDELKLFLQRCGL